MKKQILNSNGITLIALVITIIVLLLLAGVTIAALTGENGILSKATEARAAQALGDAKDQCAIIAAEAAEEYYKTAYVNQTEAYSTTGLDTAIVTALNEKKLQIEKNGVTATISGTGTGATITLQYNKKESRERGTIRNGTITWRGTIYSGVESNTEVNYSNDIKTKLVVNPEAETDEGKSPYVTYNGETYRVLYDANSEYGIEIVSVNPVTTIKLGYEDAALPAELAEATNFEKAKWSYNNAITTLNDKAKEYIVAGIADNARCIGSDPSDPYSPDNDPRPEMYTSSYSYMNDYNGVFKKETTHHTIDQSQLDSLGIAGYTDKTNSKYYWLASRRAVIVNTNSFFRVRFVTTSGDLNSDYLCHVQRANGVRTLSYSREYGFRPVIHLASGAQITSGEGTVGSPYILSANQGSE